MSAKNSALVIVAATAAALALLAVCMVALWPVLRDSSPDSPAVPTTPHAPSPPAATAQSASHEYPPIAIPRATIRPAAADSSPADAAPQNAGDVPLNSNMPSGLASVTSSRIVRTLPLSDDQRFLIEEFEQQFEPHATQRLAATSAIMRQATDRVRAAGQLQRQSNSADDNVPTQDEWLKLRESLAVHRQEIGRASCRGRVLI